MIIAYFLFILCITEYAVYDFYAIFMSVLWLLLLDVGQNVHMYLCHDVLVVVSILYVCG